MSFHLFRSSVYRKNNGYLLTNLGKVYKVAETKFNRYELQTFYETSEVEMKYMHDGVPRSFESFEVKYGPYAEYIWDDAIHS